MINLSKNNINLSKNNINLRIKQNWKNKIIKQVKIKINN